MPLASHLRQAMLRLRHLVLRSRLHQLHCRLFGAMLKRDGALIMHAPASNLSPRLVELTLEIIDLRFKGCDLGITWVGPHDGGDQKCERAEN
jgi:hypothetical protein